MKNDGISKKALVNWFITILFTEQDAPLLPGCRQVDCHSFHARHVKINLSSLKPGHTPGGLVRGGAQRDSGAGRGRAAQDAEDGTVRREKTNSLTPQTIRE